MPFAAGMRCSNAATADQVTFGDDLKPAARPTPRWIRARLLTIGGSQGGQSAGATARRLTQVSY